MTVAKGAAVAVALSIVACVTASAQAQTAWRGWQGSSVNSPDRAFLSNGAQPAGNSYGTQRASNVYASCYEQRTVIGGKRGMLEFRVQTICP